MKHTLVACTYLSYYQGMAYWGWSSFVNDTGLKDPDLDSKVGGDSLLENVTNSTLLGCAADWSDAEPITNEMAACSLDSLIMPLVLVLNICTYASIVLYVYLLYQQRNSEQKQYREMVLCIATKCEGLANQWFAERAKLPVSCVKCASSAVGRPSGADPNNNRSYFSKGDPVGPSSMYVAPPSM